MRKYIFRYDDELICTRIIDGQEKTFYGDKAINLLVKKDKINFRKIRLQNNRIVMQSAKTEVVIRNLEDMYDNGMFDYFYNNISKINKAYHKSTKKKLTNGQKFGFATVGIMAAIMLAVTAGKIKDRSNEVIPIEFDQDEELEDEETFVQNIVSEPISDMAMHISVATPEEEISEYSMVTDPNELLNELEQIDEAQALESYLGDAQVVRLAYDSEYDEIKYNYARENFDEYMGVRAPRWGVCPALGRCMLTQESGGYNTNLMQIQFNSWHDQEITLYNYETERMETIILTNNPDSYVKKPNTQYITEKDLDNPKTNISVGCILLQYSFEKMEHNIPAAIQCYNFGTGNMNTVLEEAANNLGITVDELISDQTNTDWLPYRDIIDVGDKNYLEHCLRYITNPEEEIWMNYIDENGNVEKVSITLYNENVAKSL